MRVRTLWQLADVLLKASEIIEHSAQDPIPISTEIWTRVEDALTQVEDALNDAKQPWVERDVWEEYQSYCHKASQPERLAKLRKLPMVER